MNNENTQNLSQIQLPIGFDEIKIPKRKIWRKEAAVHFHVSPETIDYRWSNNHPDLLNWVNKWNDKYKKSKMEALTLARILKNKN